MMRPSNVGRLKSAATKEGSPDRDLYEGKNIWDFVTNTAMQ